MSDTEIFLEDYLHFKEKTSDQDKFFTREHTLKLLELYKKYRPRLGSFEVKSLKKLWELVARDLSNSYKIKITPSKCENRFKVLERNYKKFVDNNNKTGRGRKMFEYEDEMDDIFGKRRNINPVVLLSSASNSTKHPESEHILVEEGNPIPSCSYEVSGISSQCFEVIVAGDEAPGPSTSKPTQRNNEKGPSGSLKRKRTVSPAYQKRNDILLGIKNDLKVYYEKKNKREDEKLVLAKQTFAERERRTNIAREYLEYLKQQENKDKSED